MVEVEGFCFANQCSDILDEFDAQERFGLGWSWGLRLELLSALFNASGDELTSLFPHLNANLSPIPLLCHFFFISFVRKSVLEFEILNLFFGLLEKYEARIKNQNFFTWMKVYNW